MATHKLLLLPGDGIGPEVIGEVQKLIGWFRKSGIASFETETDLVGGAAYDAHGVAITDAAMQRAQAADAVLFGAVGGPKWDAVPYDKRPEAGLLRLRKDLGLFANLRPAICYPALADASSLKREVVEGLDIVIVRELTGGVYFGEPKEIVTLESGEKRAVDTQVYTTHEIERIARVAFDLAGKRRRKVASSEKRNVMKSGVLWNEVVTRVHREEFSDIALEHVLADNCAMQLVRWPKQFDVIVTDNLFGDVLSDIASMLTGSLGMLPSASLGAEDAKTGKRPALYEPVHGSAPDIAGRGLANPIAMIGSLGMALRYSFGLTEAADLVERAIANVLAAGLRTQGHRRSGHQRGRHRRDGRGDRERAGGPVALTTGQPRARQRRPENLMKVERRHEMVGSSPTMTCWRSAHEPVGRDVVDRADRVAGADEGTVGDRVGQAALAEAVLHVLIRRQVEIGLHLAVAAGGRVLRADRDDVAGVEIAARPHVDDDPLLAAAAQGLGIGLRHDREGARHEGAGGSGGDKDETTHIGSSGLGDSQARPTPLRNKEI